MGAVTGAFPGEPKFLGTSMRTDPPERGAAVRDIDLERRLGGEVEVRTFDGRVRAFDLPRAGVEHGRSICNVRCTTNPSSGWA
ncbi:hypothetical protein [Nonomuraea sediminis]|uniref:hypothetical protein n=1 Tax=Nonomuraea sediminis TaxID=2835864 RepID=UPI001BDC68D0|nr:hypothetical protein [Nonomuraea sediminis]